MVKKYIDASDIASELKKLQNGTATPAVTAVANAAGQTWTAAAVVGGYILRSGAAAVSDTTPTAADLVAALPGVAVGGVKLLRVRNSNSGTLTIVAGTGVTLEGTTTIATVNTRVYAVRFTAVASGSEAVTLSGISTSGV